MLQAKIADFIVEKRKIIIALFLIFGILCIPLALVVKINYDILDYLPESSQSTIGLDTMEAEYRDSIPNTTVMVQDVTIAEALEYKERFLALENVESALWLDDSIEVKEPLEFADQSTVANYYKDGDALFFLAVRSGTEQETVAALHEIVGPDNAVGGQIAIMASIRESTTKEVGMAFAFLIPALLVILLLSTRSWLEPPLMLLSIGIAIILNMGTNIIFDDVSFITNSVSPILQLAVSMDYAIFLQHRFINHRKEGYDVPSAMKRALITSFSTETSSASTTLFGFLALVFMQFLIGADLGINLLKGIIFSFLSAFFFLPALVITCHKAMDKVNHKPLLPDFKGAYKYLGKVAIPVTVLVVILVVPSYMGQSRTDFLYGSESAGAGYRAFYDTQKITEAFGETNINVVMVPRGDVMTEARMSNDLKELDYVNTVISYPEIAGVQFPLEVVGSDVRDRFYSENYARSYVYLSLPTEGEQTFDTVEQIMEVAEEYYGDSAYVVGRSASLYDMRTVVQTDAPLVNMIAIISILLVLVLTFRSGILPLLLTLTIEAAIWINLAVPYFTATNVNYIGYLMLHTVQLGATVDYAILLSTTYMRDRKVMHKAQAIHHAMGISFKSIVTSAFALSLAGFVLFITSSNSIVKDIGMMLGRGTILSFLLVICVLPLLLQLLDPIIGKLTYKANFLKKGEVPLLYKGDAMQHINVAIKQAGEH